jgi:hypothetical protein
MVSSTWSQRGHCAGCGSPLLASRSAVQHLLCATSHMKKRHLGGAHDFQILSYGPKRVDPKKKPSYADLAKYCPLEERRQMWESSTSGCSCQSKRRSQRLKNSSITSTVVIPLMSRTHARSVRASSTVRLFTILFGTKFCLNYNSICQEQFPCLPFKAWCSGTLSTCTIHGHTTLFLVPWLA